MPVAVSRVVDHQMRIEADLRDPSWEGGCLRLAHYLNPGEAACGWFGQVIRAPSRSAIVMYATMAPIAMATPLPKLTAVLVLGTAAPYTL